MPSPAGLIRKPRPEWIRDARGAVRAAYLALRTDPPVRAVRPDRRALVYFYLGSDDFPVGVKFLEPKADVAIGCMSTLLFGDRKGGRSPSRRPAKRTFPTRDSALRFFVTFAKAAADVAQGMPALRGVGGR